MKTVFTILFFLCFTQLILAQDLSEPGQITPKILEKIKSEVEKKAIAFKKTFKEDEFSKDRIEFMSDTFRINHIADMRMNIDYSTAGMNETTDELTKAYDKMMNKYYNKLVALISAEDKQVLLNAQRAWLSFRDAEMKLTYKLCEEKYSGGGTIQSLIANGNYEHLVKNRMCDLFEYYDAVMK